MSEVHDIAIIGGGITGAALAYFLQGRRSVVLLEQESALGFHSTGRSAAEFTRRFHSPEVGQLTQASAGFMMTPLPGFAEIDLLRPRGNLLIADAEKADHLRAVYDHECANAPKDTPPVEFLSVDQAMEKVPFLDPGWVNAAFYDPDCWDVEVETLLQGYVRGAKAQGAEFQQRATVTGATRENGHWVIETSAGEMCAKTVVNASGGWADPLAKIFGANALGIIPHRRTAISVKVPGHELTHIPEVNEIDELFYFKPDAGQLMVSPADETPVDPHDAWPEELDVAYAAHYLGECTTLEVTHVAHSWAGLRTFAPDRLPVIGFSEQVEGLFWLAGVGGYGIQTSPAVGQIAAALLSEAPLPHPVADFDPRLFSPSRLER
ncbi:NAD(P)/FAD-dependent oxidoreductase [Falsiruegeria mediterranea]|uniref:FAD-dependent catabolic D-arginine dehydrogenase DauA n=1 Tax=Falsiruegeria mediterranea M17 TaxID=1200281 RepID=A0A2R8CEV6_9RHOB|nr:FAD-binding oxidoreductase [Falsiruegeria mediterranea]SPJ30965.1 FAD-dependent catabolic D-arginine dehydrogenase DauA [Falsiruegeria mediterranea M17]